MEWADAPKSGKRKSGLDAAAKRKNSGSKSGEPKFGGGRPVFLLLARDEPVGLPRLNWDSGFALPVFAEEDEEFAEDCWLVD